MIFARFPFLIHMCFSTWNLTRKIKRLIRIELSKLFQIENTLSRKKFSILHKFSSDFRILRLSSIKIILIKILFMKTKCSEDCNFSTFLSFKRNSSCKWKFQHNKSFEGNERNLFQWLFSLNNRKVFRLQLKEQI